jgi:glycosyltransferase involved in cell wall biosynthesis
MLELWHRVYLDGDFSPRAELTLSELGLGEPQSGRVLGHHGRQSTTGEERAVRRAPGAVLGTDQRLTTNDRRSSEPERSDVDDRATLRAAPSRPCVPPSRSILLATADEPSSGRGDAARLIREWAPRLAARGAAVTVLTATEGSDPPVREECAGVTYLRGRPDRSLRGAPMFDVISIHHPRAGRDLARVLSREVPRVYTFGTPLGERYQSRATEAALPVRRATLRALEEYERQVIRSCGTVLTSSQYALREAIGLHGLPSARVHAIPTGVDVERFRPRSDRRALRREYGLTESGFLLLAVESLTPGTGIERLITAMAGITEAYPEAHLVLVGEGPMEPALRRQVAEQGLGRAVTFAGVVPEIVLPEYYALADLCVLPRTRPDRDGLVALEALACGTPVVATPVGALPEILRPLDPGALFAGDTAGAIADGIIRRLPEVHHDDALRRRCRRHTEQHYSWEAVLPMLEALLHQAATRRRSVPRPVAPAPQSPAQRVARSLLRPRACAD